MTLSNRHVLIADDDPFVMRLLEKFLREEGYEVSTAPDGRAAMTIVLDRAPPIIIADWVMPGMDGIELCKALRAHEGVRFAYVIMVTAHHEPGRLVSAFAAGADDFIAKPVYRQELLARVRAGERICRLEEDLAQRTREMCRLSAETTVANRKLAELNGRLVQMASTDDLTGLLNRREALKRLDALWEIRNRYGTTFSCLTLDIDHFKRINDTSGHPAGDAVLRQLAVIIRAQLRATDLACRMGGEEFLVLLPETTIEGGAACAEKLRKAIDIHAFRYEGHIHAVAVSVGVAGPGPVTASPEDLLHDADAALYQSKANGRNRVTIASHPAVTVGEGAARSPSGTRRPMGEPAC
jgi:diguanylate cyclase (GGDEF)-like protein